MIFDPCFVALELIGRAGQINSFSCIKLHELHCNSVGLESRARTVGLGSTIGPRWESESGSTRDRVGPKPAQFWIFDFLV